MGRADWYRSEDWSPEIAEVFWSRLKRVRSGFDAAQYLRIQASYLQEAGRCEPALDLLEVFFRDYAEEIEIAAAYKTRAECLLVLGREDEALEAFRESVAAEARFPNVQVGAAFDFAVHAVLTDRRDLYDEVTEVVLHAVKARAVMLPVDRFKVLAVGAIIETDKGDVEKGRRLASSALEIAGIEHSGIRYHAKVGLVRESSRPLVEAMVRLLGGN